ncbi:MAG: hypothetical protein RMY62_029475 [Nostoc sp. ZfuVER08]
MESWGDGKLGRWGDEFFPSLPMPNAPCPMPNAQCPMPHTPYP